MARAAPPAPSTITGRRPFVPVGRFRFEIGDEAVGVGVAGAKPAGLVEPQRVGGADRPRRFVGHRRQPQGRFLVRQGHIGAGIAPLLERAEKARKILRPHRFFLVGAVNAVLREPIAMDRG